MEASPFHRPLFSAVCCTSLITAEHDFCPRLRWGLGFCLALSHLATLKPPAPPEVLACHAPAPGLPGALAGHQPAPFLWGWCFVDWWGSQQSKEITEAQPTFS